MLDKPMRLRDQLMAVLRVWQVRMSPAKNSTARVVTAIRYRDVDGAAEWLQAAFGFSLRAKVLDDDGRAGMVQLTYGNHLVMMLPVGGSELDTLMRQPDEIGGAETQSCYLVVSDVEQHHDRAKAAGADIVNALKAFDKGGHGYTCRDLEGHLWSFGSYDPWSEPSAPAVSRAIAMGKRLSAPASLAAAVGAVVLLGAGWGLWHAFTHSTTVEDRLASQLMLAKDKADQAIDLAARRAADLAKERAAKKWIGLDVQRAKLQLALERGARETAEKSLQQSEMNNAAERSARSAAKEAAAVAYAAAARERASKETAERAVEAMRKEVTLANAVKLKAERSTKEAAEQLARERAAREAAETLARAAQEKLKQAQTSVPGVANAAKQPATTKKAANTPDVPASGQPPLPPLLP
jgi:uncharacterized glyoxalase superfamily protein PhnB